MVCQRCQGLLVCETFDDLNIDTDSLYTGTRCLNCGCIEDAVIRANRSRRSATMRRSRSGRGRTRDIERINIHVDAYASIQ
jgi:RNase P subunit RPR2